jgi:hypothetical protein
MLTVPFTDDSIIPVIIANVIPSKKPAEEDMRTRKSGFLKRIKGDKKNDGKGRTKVVFMPRRDYLKWFARDLRGEYTGTAPYKQWTEDELDEMFRPYRPIKREKRGYRPSF